MYENVPGGVVIEQIMFYLINVAISFLPGYSLTEVYVAFPAEFLSEGW